MALGTADVKVRADTKEAQRKLKQTQKTIKKIGSVAKTIVPALSGVALAMKGIQISKQAFQEFAKFESAIRNVTTLTDKLSFRRIRDEILRLPSILASTTEYAEGLYEVLSAGIPDNSAIKFTEQAAKLARAGLTDVQTSARALTKIINAYGKDAKDAAKVSDILFTTVKKGQINMEQLSQQMGKIAALGAKSGVSIEEMGAAIAVITKNGIPAERAGTSLQAVLQSLLKPTEALKDALKEYGYESGVAVIESEGLIGAFNLFYEAARDNPAIMAELTGQIQALTPALILASQNGEEFAATQREIAESTGNLNEGLKKQNDDIIPTLSAAWESFSAQLGKNIKANANTVADTIGLVRILSKEAEFMQTVSQGREVGALIEAGDYKPTVENLKEIITLLDEWNSYNWLVRNTTRFPAEALEKAAEGIQRELQARISQKIGIDIGINPLSLEELAKLDAEINAFFEERKAKLQAQRDAEATIAEPRDFASAEAFAREQERITNQERLNELKRIEQDIEFIKGIEASKRTDIQQLIIEHQELLNEKLREETAELKKHLELGRDYSAYLDDIENIESFIENAKLGQLDAAGRITHKYETMIELAEKRLETAEKLGEAGEEQVEQLRESIGLMRELHSAELERLNTAKQGSRASGQGIEFPAKLLLNYEKHIEKQKKATKKRFRQAQENIKLEQKELGLKIEKAKIALEGKDAEIDYAIVQNKIIKDEIALFEARGTADEKHVNALKRIVEENNKTIQPLENIKKLQNEQKDLSEKSVELKKQEAWELARIGRGYGNIGGEIGIVAQIPDPLGRLTKGAKKSAREVAKFVETVKGKVTELSTTLTNLKPSPLELTLGGIEVIESEIEYIKSRLAELQPKVIPISVTGVRPAIREVNKLIDGIKALKSKEITIVVNRVLNITENRSDSGGGSSSSNKSYPKDKTGRGRDYIGGGNYRGGIVPGQGQAGALYRLGDRNTAEAIIPLKKLESMFNLNKKNRTNTIAPVFNITVNANGEASGDVSNRYVRRLLKKINEVKYQGDLEDRYLNVFTN